MHECKYTQVRHAANAGVYNLVVYEKIVLWAQHLPYFCYGCGGRVYMILCQTKEKKHFLREGTYCSKSG